MNINDLIAEAHENAVAHGFWEEDRPFAEIVDLIHSELSEALEEFRDGRELNEVYHSCQYSKVHNVPLGHCRKNITCAQCEYGKPEGIPIEFADTVIRICDYFGSKNIKNGNDLLGFRPKKRAQTLCELLAACHKLISTAYSYNGRVRERNYLKGVIDEVQDFCQRNGIDLDRAIKLKMEYNKTRPYKHGKKI